MRNSTRAGDSADDISMTQVRPFKPLQLVAVVACVLLGISFWLKWYTGAVSLPRYCDNPAQTLQHLEKVLTQERPADEESRRPYIIAAKLIYLIPQQRNESVQNYLQRLQIRIAEQCR